jgi:thioredoxin reductase
LDGVFACGDVQASCYRQAIKSARLGCIAASHAEQLTRLETARRFPLFDWR